MPCSNDIKDPYPRPDGTRVKLSWLSSLSSSDLSLPAWARESMIPGTPGQKVNWYEVRGQANIINYQRNITKAFWCCVSTRLVNRQEGSQRCLFAYRCTTSWSSTQMAALHARPQVIQQSDQIHPTFRSKPLYSTTWDIISVDCKSLVPAKLTYPVSEIHYVLCISASMQVLGELI